MDGALGIILVIATTIGAGALSGLVPILNSEIYLVGVVLGTGRGSAMALALAASLALGQVSSKVILYYAARGGARSGRGRFAEKLALARQRAVRWQSKPYSVAFLAATVGVPPFYVMALVAGVLELRIRRFFAICLVGRVIRFGTIALVAIHA